MKARVNLFPIPMQLADFTDFLAGQAATTLRVTMQRTLPGGTNAFDTIAQNTNVTDAGWVTMQEIGRAHV